MARAASQAFPYRCISVVLTQFPKLYFDEDVSIILVRKIAARGFETLTVQEAGKRSLSDESQLQVAVQHEAVMITHNRLDFERLFSEWVQAGRLHYGIVLVKRRHHVSDMASKILALLHTHSVDDLKNSIRYV